jgi:hypothetical protein
MRKIVTQSLGAAVVSLAGAWVLVSLAAPVPAALCLFVALEASLVAGGIRIARRVGRSGMRAAAFAALALLLLPGSIVLGALSSAVVNNFRLARFSAQLFTYPLPPGTQLITRSANVGVLTGNGDHCDFIARVDLGGEASLESLRDHYSGLHLDAAIPGGAGGGLPRIEIVAASGGQATGYAVIATDAAYEGVFDVRCM